MHRKMMKSVGQPGSPKEKLFLTRVVTSAQEPTESAGLEAHG